MRESEDLRNKGLFGTDPHGQPLFSLASKRATSLAINIADLRTCKQHLSLLAPQSALMCYVEHYSFESAIVPRDSSYYKELDEEEPQKREKEQ